MLKNAYFLRKNCKNRLSVGGFALEPPAAGDSGSRPPRCYSRLLLQPVGFVSSAKCIFSALKRTK